MSKILISSIGTGQKKDGGYRLAKYEYNGKVKETPFISKALCEFLDIDKLYLVGTSGSIWDSVYSEFGGSDEEVELELYEKQEQNVINEKDLEIIEEQINKFLNSKNSKCFLIEYGVNEDELWKNFEIYLRIFDNIEKDDEVYIDISHSFRSLALLSFVMLQFGNTIRKKDFKLKGVFYGMLEYSSQNNGITPVVDLKILFDLIEWMKAIENLTNYGNADKIAMLVNDKKEKNLFNNLSLSLRMANLAAIKDNVNSLAKKLAIIETSNNKIVKLLLPELYNFINKLNKEKHSDFQLALSEWFCEHKHYALGYLALIEAIVSKVCEVKDYDVLNEEDRNRAKKEISSIDKALFFEVYRIANRIRNDIAHQIGKRKSSLLSDANSLKGFIEKTKRIFKNC
ncbi:hypothetical protein JCM11957_01400 [Caminibacter profundus]